MKIPAISTIKTLGRGVNRNFIKYGMGAALALSAIQLTSCVKERDFDDLIVQPPKNKPVDVVIDDSIKTYTVDVFV